jgi:hypothetical protein
MSTKGEKVAASQIGRVGIEILKRLLDGEWHNGVSISMTVGGYVRPEIAMRAAATKLRVPTIDRGRGMVVYEKLRKWRQQGKVLSRRSIENQGMEWQLKDKAWANSILEILSLKDTQKSTAAGESSQGLRSTGVGESNRGPRSIGVEESTSAEAVLTAVRMRELIREELRKLRIEVVWNG